MIATGCRLLGFSTGSAVSEEGLRGRSLNEEPGRLRPILMTSLAFIFGALPLVWAIGAGAEQRQTLGAAVFSGMIGVTAFGLFFMPVFYVGCRWLALRMSRRATRRRAGRVGEPSSRDTGSRDPGSF